MAGDAVVVFGLYKPRPPRGPARAIDIAYETLIDEERRRAYDLEIFPDGQVPRRRAGTPAPQSGPPSGIDRTGPIVQDLVEAPSSRRRPAAAAGTPTSARRPSSPGRSCARSARRAASTSRPSRSGPRSPRSYLKAIEDETVRSMPAPVYVRGFLVEYARFLRST